MLRTGSRGNTSPMKWLLFVNLRLPMVNLLQPREMSAKMRLSVRSQVYER